MTASRSRMLSVRRSHDYEMSRSLFFRWLTDDSGQDILEYVLLCSFIGFGALVSINLVNAAMKDTYSAWDAAAQSDELVEVPDPAEP
jgi:hypothetical protein